ncbi:MAG: hypothetical protein EOL97_00860 [Spirochaetia bacterium]|nr:hypothetical protein [Spirochaetia bacterium]
MEAQVKKEILLVENSNAKEVFEKYRSEGKIGIIDFSTSFVVFPSSEIIIKKYKESKVDVAFSQLKRWISSEAFDQVFVLNGLDVFQKELVFEWLFDHKKKVGFPNLIISGNKIELFWEQMNCKIIKE